MSVQTSTHDVFLSYSITEGRTADFVRLAFSEAGLGVFDAAAVEPGSNIEDVLRLALAETAAVVVVVDTQREPASTTMVELGAAMAWHKPIYVVHADTGVVKLPSYLQEYPTYPVCRIDDLVRMVKHDTEPLSNKEIAILSSLYQDLQTPVDSLLGEPALIETLARRFSTRSHKKIAGERLVQELLRLRMAGTLPSLRG